MIVTSIFLSLALFWSINNYVLYKRELTLPFWNYIFQSASLAGLFYCAWEEL